ncbi:hypothetical protein [Phenylobacterium sp.]|uniref:hypothetical protein n=1 Tax=Phenylobacterium sp. TaxID=1871053 RepID=UPI00286CD75B|nr:hypothetical protein [Phenylobacterium sp.]
MDNAKVETAAERTREERSVERVAVIFTHGQGEQVPMQDVVELAHSIWTLNGESALSDPPINRGVWSVPVYDADMSEQRRLVTSTLRREGEPDLQVDFYQFYWADLMQGNRLVHVWRWFMDLMNRDQAEVPEPLTPIRKLAMASAFWVGLVAWLFGLVTAVRLWNADLLSWSNFWALLIVFLLAAQAYWLSRRPDRAKALTAGVILIAASLLLGAFTVPLLQNQCQMVELVQKGPGCFGYDREAYASLTPHVSTLLATAHSLIAALMIVVLIGLAFLGYVLSRTFFVPVMADSARMLRATPENLPARDRIRKRGMELLEALHNSERRYDRIVFLSHSLGTVVAYNVLMQYWGNVYRLFDHTASTAEREAVEAAGAALQDLEGQALVDARLSFRSAVRAYHKALCHPKSRLDPASVEWRTTEYASSGQLLRGILKTLRGRAPNAPVEESRCPWLVSDLITVGSPLTYGSLLMAKDHDDFKDQVRVRRYAVCPPSETASGSFTYAGKPHHAAVFGVTCWTNIFFETESLFRGDIVGGPVAKEPPEGFGRGPLDVAVRREPGMPGFAHSEYWRWATDAEGRPAEHVLALRNALHLFGDADKCDQNLKGLAPPRGRAPKSSTPAAT